MLKRNPHGGKVAMKRKAMDAGLKKKSKNNGNAMMVGDCAAENNGKSLSSYFASACAVPVRCFAGAAI